MPDVTRRQFTIGAGLLGVAAADQLKILISEAEAQGLKRVTHAVSAGDISSLDPTLAWVSAESPINPVVMEGLV
jgi:peptide/nickel transport system substrate-binding protein